MAQAHNTLGVCIGQKDSSRFVTEETEAQSTQSVIDQRNMLMSSILTNNSAMVALQTLKSINMDLGKVQSEISTGKTVESAKDNASVWRFF